MRYSSPSFFLISLGKMSKDFGKIRDGVIKYMKSFQKIKKEYLRNRKLFNESIAEIDKLNTTIPKIMDCRGLKEHVHTAIGNSCFTNFSARYAFYVGVCVILNVRVRV